MTAVLSVDIVTKQYYYADTIGDRFCAMNRSGEMPVIEAEVTDVLLTNDDDTHNGTAEGETIKGLGGSDKIAGNAGDDFLFGGGGADLLLGGQGVDVLKGGTGRDTLFGGSGDDVLNGGSGADVLSGDRGADTLTGGHGIDTFVFNLNTIDAMDTVTDFANGETIQLNGFEDETVYARVESGSTFLFLMVDGHEEDFAKLQGYEGEVNIAGDVASFTDIPPEPF